MLVELSVVEQRYRAVLEVTQAKIPVNAVAERYGVSRQTLHAWIKRYAAEGIGGLIDLSRRPAHIPLQISPEVEAAICEMRRQHSRYGPVTIGYWLDKCGVSPLPSRTTIYRVLVRNHLVLGRIEQADRAAIYQALGLTVRYRRIGSTEEVKLTSTLRTVDLERVGSDAGSKNSQVTGLPSVDLDRVGGGTRHNAVRALDAYAAWGSVHVEARFGGNPVREVGTTELWLPAA